MNQSENDQQNQVEAKNEPNARQKIELARGKNVPMDYFLYSCLEHERTQRAQFGEDLPTAGRWPLMVGASAENLPAGFDGQDLKTLLNRMCGWYCAQYPDILEEIPLDHEVLNNIVPPFMNFTIDLADLVFLKTATSLPSHNADTEESQKLWSDIGAALKDSFPGYHGYFIRFLKWAFADVEPEEFEPGSRPPVGKNMPNFRAIANAQNYQQAKQHKGPNQHQNRDSSNHNRGNQNRSQGGRGNPQHQNRHQQNNQNQHGGNNQRNRHHNNHQGNHQGNHQNKPRHAQPQQQQADSEIEKAALSAVDDAISRITKGEVDEVFLKPMNSFYRRIQHQYAVDKGFESCSVGEGNERGVKVAKPLKG